MDGHLLSVYRIQLHASITAAGMVTGTVISFTYVRLIQSTVASPNNHWPKVDNLGVITGCSLAKFPNGKGRRKLGAERLYRILMTESAHLIWRIRCERIIERNDKEQWHTAQEIKNRWHCAINKRLTLDQAMTNKRYETKAISFQTVLCTWSGTLQDELSLPDNWINYSGVLVGIRPPEQPWWQRQLAEPP